MNILLLAPEVSFPPPLEGGGEVFLHHICMELKYLGHGVEVLSASKKGDLEFDAKQPYIVHRYPVFPRRLFTAIIIVFETLFYGFNGHADVMIIGHFMTIEALGVWLLRKVFRLSYTILIHGLDLQSALRSRSMIHKAVTYTVLRNASMIFANSRFTAKSIVEAGYVGKIVVLNPGVDTGRFHPNLSTEQIRQKYNITNSQKVILSVSRLVRRKGHDNVLRALSLIVSKKPDVVYLIVGRGEEERVLKALAEDLGVQKHVRFLGYVDDKELPHLYCASDIFVLPVTSIDEEGNYEGFGIVFSEANACAKPVIGGKSGGVSDAIVDGVTGLLVNPNSIDEITRAIITLLSNEQYSEALGTQGRKRVEEELSWPIVGKRLEAALQSLIET